MTTAAHDDVLKEAAEWVAVLRRAGYPEAQVAPEYCIGGEIGPDRFFTRTVSVWVGPHKPESMSPTIAKAFAAAVERASQFLTPK